VLLHHYRVLLATGPGDLPVFGILTGGSVQFSSRPRQKPDQHCLRGVVTRTGHKPMVFLAGVYQDHCSISQFLQLWLQLSISVVIVLWHDQYVDCTDLTALLPPACRLAIRPIFVEWVWKNVQPLEKFAGFWLRLNEYWSDRKSNGGGWESGRFCTIYVLTMSWYDQHSDTYLEPKL